MYSWTSKMGMKPFSCNVSEGISLSADLPSTLSSLQTANESFVTERYHDADTDVGDSGFWSLVGKDNLRHSVGWSIVLIIAYLTIFFVGAIGNSLVISILLFKSPVRTVARMFLLNLAFADLLVIVVCVPATLLANLYIPWVLGAFMCKGMAYVQGATVCASVYSLAALSLDRFKAIYRPTAQQKGLSKRQARVSILLIWISSLFIALPWLYAFEIRKSEHDGQLYCLEEWGNEDLGKVYFVVIILIICFIFPSLFICISNTAIWRHVSNREVPQDSAAIRSIHTRTRRSVIKTLGTVTLAFLISWVPLYALATYLKFSSFDDMEEWEETFLSYLLPFAQWLGSLNSSMNPIFYAFINSKFRNGFKNLFSSLISKDEITKSKSMSFHRQSQKVLRRQNGIRRKRGCLNSSQILDETDTVEKDGSVNV